MGRMSEALQRPTHSRAAEMALTARCQPAAAVCPRYSPSEPKSPKMTAPRAQLHLRSAHHPQMLIYTHRFFTNRFFTFSPSLPNAWVVSLFVGPVWQWQEQEEQECLCGPGAGSTWSCHSPSLWCPAEGMSRSEEQVQICLVQRLWDSPWQHSAQTDTSLHKKLALAHSKLWALPGRGSRQGYLPEGTFLA